MTRDEGAGAGSILLAFILGAVSGAAVALLLPTLAVGFRRLHDTDRSGWCLLIAFLPLIGPVVLIVWFCTRGTDGANRYGSDPRRTEEFLRLHLGGRDYEVFGLLHLNTRHRLIAAEDLFRGTLDGSSVYPREVVQSVIKHRSAS